MEGTIKPLVYPYFCKEDFMKKTLAILLALVVVGGLVFAQDAPAAIGKVGMWNEGDVTLINNDYNTAWGPSWAGSGWYNSLTTSYDGNNVSFSMTAEFGDDVLPLKLRNYGATYTAFGGIAKISGGKLRTGFDYRMTNYSDASGFSTRLANAETGIALQLYPITGLSLGAFVPVQTAAQAAETTYAKTAFGAAYTVDKVAKVMASYMAETKEIFVGADVKAVEKLTLQVGYKNVLDASNNFYVNAGYPIMDKLALNGYADLNLASAGTLTYGAKGFLEYTVDPYMLGVAVAYDNGDAWIKNNGIEVKPYAVYNFGDSSVQLAFDLVSSSGTTTWSVPLSYVISF